MTPGEETDRTGQDRTVLGDTSRVCDVTGKKKGGRHRFGVSLPKKYGDERELAGCMWGTFLNSPVSNFLMTESGNYANESQSNQPVCTGTEQLLQVLGFSRSVSTFSSNCSFTCILQLFRTRSFHAFLCFISL